jgi:hypothetical protein
MPKKKKFDELKKLMDIPEVEALLRARLPVLIQRMFDLAEGIVCVDYVVDPETGEEVPRAYKVPPDRQALQFLIENAIGKVPQRLEMTGKGGGPVQVIPWAPTTAFIEDGVIEGEGRLLSDGSPRES